MTSLPHAGCVCQKSWRRIFPLPLWRRAHWQRGVRRAKCAKEAVKDTLEQKGDKENREKLKGRIFRGLGQGLAYPQHLKGGQGEKKCTDCGENDRAIHCGVGEYINNNNR